GEAEFDQRPVQEAARIVAGERTSGAIGAAQAGRQADDQQTRIAWAERRHRRVEPRRLTRAQVAPQRQEARAEGAVARRLGRAARPLPAAAHRIGALSNSRTRSARGGAAASSSFFSSAWPSPGDWPRSR